MNSDAARTGVKREEISQWKVAAYGGLAGEALWLASYPFDVVKSKMQCDGFGTGKRYAGMIDCFRQTFRKEGLGGFWRGIGPTLMRALPVSAGTFAVYVGFYLVLCLFCVTIFPISCWITNEWEQQGRNDDESDQLRNHKNIWIFWISD